MINKISINHDNANTGIVYHEAPDGKFIDLFNLPVDLLDIQVYFRDKDASPFAKEEWMIDIYYGDYLKPFLYGLKIPGGLSGEQLDEFLDGLSELQKKTYMEKYDNHAIFSETLFSPNDLKDKLDGMNISCSSISGFGWREMIEGEKNPYSRLSVEYIYHLFPTWQRFFFPTHIKNQDLKNLIVEFRKLNEATGGEK